MYETSGTIEINNNNIYSNRTFKYLTPCLKDWGKDFVDQVGKLPLQAWGIGDCSVNSVFDEDNLYCLIVTDGTFKNNRNFVLNKVSDFLDWFRSHPSYHDDYEYDDFNGNKHMLVVNLPEQHKGIITKFINGSYSSMYNKDTIDRLFNKKMKIGRIEQDNDKYLVLTHDSRYREVFKKRLKEDFNYNSGDIAIDAEYDYPPILGEEIFNYERL